MLGGIGRRLFAGVALVHKRHLPNSPVVACTAWANCATCARSCSLAGVTFNANNTQRVMDIQVVGDPDKLALARELRCCTTMSLSFLWTA